jgi:hypothetical protein
MKYVVTRDVTKAECPWLDDEVKSGTQVHRFSGCTYGCISENGTAVTFDKDGPFCELPDDSLRAVS